MASASEINQSCWLDGPGQDFVVREAPMPSSKADEVIVRTRAVAMNPVDAIRQKLGLMIPEDAYPYIIGNDAAGIIHAKGDAVTHLEVGDRVTVLCDEFIVVKADHSTFQRYFCTTAKQVCKIPDEISFEDAVVLPLTLSTAAGALFERESMDLSWPRLNDSELQAKQKQQHANDVVIVFGASSAVGLCAIQMLVLAGYHVVATSSKHNFELVKEAGAEAVFDYKEDTCVDNVSNWVNQHKYISAGVLAAVIDQTGKSFEQCAAVSRKVPGRKLVGTTMARGMMEEPKLGEDIKTSSCLAIVQPDLLEYVWKDWLPLALRTGEMKCLPRPDIVGQGLGSVDEACKIMGGGVSGKKLVVSGI